MSIQFRSRINNFRPITTDPGWTGYCCSTQTANVTRSQCAGGIFIIGATNNSQCPAQGSCVSSFLSSSGACCYWYKDGDNYTQACETTNDSLECYNKNEGRDQNLYSSFYLGRSCIADGGDIVCNGIKNYTDDYTSCVPDADTGCFDQTQIMGTCCYSKNGMSACTSCVKSQCDGTWIPPVNGTVYGCTTNRCSGLLTTGSRTPPSIQAAALSTTTDELIAVPAIGEYYQGGIYVGTFTQNTVNDGSMLYGNPNTGTPHPYKTTPDTVSESKKWILIADLQDYSSVSMGITQDAEFVTSAYDGWYNTEMNTDKCKLYSGIRNYKQNGFNDWYVPSRDELALYFNAIKLTTPIYNSVHINDGIYLSSSSYTLRGTQNFNYNYFMYGQDATTTNYGNVVLKNRKSNGKIRLFRRIYIK